MEVADDSAAADEQHQEEAENSEHEMVIGALAYSEYSDSDDDDDGPVDDGMDSTTPHDAVLARARHVRPSKQPQPPSLPPQVLVSEVDASYAVERVACTDLSVGAFRARIASATAAARCPLIIEGLPCVEDGVTAGLVADVVRASIPDDLAVPVRGHGHWPASTFFDALEAGEAVYLADASLTRHFPWIHRLVRVPSYFLHDFSHRCRRRPSVVHDTPALFVSGRDTRSALHIDQMRSNFWMFLGQGYKHWTTFHPDDAHLLSPEWDEVEQIERFPPLATLDASAVAKARRLDFTLRPHDTLFIPRGTPHEVLNLCATTAVSANFVDQTNVAETVAQTRARVARCVPGSARAENLREIADSLDEIEWPSVEDDLADVHRTTCASPRALVGRFAVHERSMSIDPVRLRCCEQEDDPVSTE